VSVCSIIGVVEYDAKAAAPMPLFWEARGIEATGAARGDVRVGREGRAADLLPTPDQLWPRFGKALRRNSRRARKRPRSTWEEAGEFPVAVADEQGETVVKDF